MTHELYIQICDYLQDIIEDTLFENHCFAVGGCVRDEILGHEIKDIDLCIDLPDGGIEFANWLYKEKLLTHEPVVYPTYGTAMFQLAAFPDIELEVVQTRKEQYKDKNSRNPEVVFGSIEEDCKRRDLTINSLYYNISKNVYMDLTDKGYNDIKNHIIRTTGEPDVIFEQDSLRILRCIRFSSRYGWEIEKETFESMKRNVDRLSIITKERIQDEFNKMLVCDNPVMALNLIKKIGAMKYIIPELEETYDMEQNKYHFGTVWEHTLKVVENTRNDLYLRMAALLHDIGKINTRTVDDNGNVHFYKHELVSAEMCDTILRRLKYSNDFIKTVQILVKNHMRTKNFGDNCTHMKDKTLRKMQYELGDNMMKCLELLDADNKAHTPEYCMPNQVENIKKRLEKFKEDGTSMENYKLPVNGNDVMEVLGIEPCAKVKECLDWLMKFAFNNPKISREELLKKIKQYEYKR